ncbi:MAG: amidohydrolase family protein [Thermodesulfobacteriota bacterium]
MKIDFHNHFYPPEYLKKLEQWGRRYEFIQDPSGLKIVKEKGARFLGITSQHVGVEQRIADMDRSGIDLQVLTLTSPNVYFSTRKRNLFLAQMSNDFFAELCQKYPKRFVAFASVPLNHPEDAIGELHRAVKDLGMKGVILGSNIDGRHLHSKELWSFYGEVDRLNLPIFIHPMVPSHPESMVEFSLVPLVGFVMDTTLSVAKMVYSGLFEEFPKLTLILPHLGGTAPFLFERIDNGYRAYGECRQNITKPPSQYLKQFYYDTVSFYPPALMCTYDAVGADHMVLGSDYPHVIGDISRAISSIDALVIPSEEKRMIFGENGKKILKLQ